MSFSSRESEAPGTVSPPRAPHVKERPTLDLAGRLALRPGEAAESMGISVRTLRGLLPRIPHVRTGEKNGAVIIPVDTLRRWLDEEAKAAGDRVDRIVREILDSR